MTNKIKETCSICGKIEEVSYSPYYCCNCKQEKSIACMNFANCDFQEYVCQECEEAANEARYQAEYEEYKENGYSGERQ